MLSLRQSRYDKPMNKAELFSEWVKSRGTPAPELMTGIQGEVGHLRLDKQGLSERGWTDLPKDWSPEESVLYAGGYLEDRAIYDSPVFTGAAEPRTIHLGVDVFAPAGASVFAPVEGVVHSLQVNAGDLDYGPTIILEHSPTPDLTFWTLYGHLSEDSLLGLEDGDPVAAGEKLAELGDKDINGGWSPHLHFQVILDIGDKEGDFPGVCAKSETDKWQANCPNPYPLIGLRLPE